MFSSSLVLIFSCAINFLNAGDVFPPAELMEEIVAPLHEMCTTRLSKTDADVASYNIETNKPDMKCYMKCLMLESKWMKESGQIDYDFIISNAHPSVKDILLAAIDKCMHVEYNDDLCEHAYNFNVCLHNADPVHYFLP
ncbi:uncharacterized protein LOC123305375 isoform X1 [Chrysoperla carnea]|uniref:uncharacterized protein LOC123305375 isoform X1 n=1 Tax=Chrysoperla carnea TaxID=189513 RepID=UPI001D065D1D|nr:uncharacterized protein LOC123305375 isoform X1 [Chrysoperla carnea]